MKSGSEGKSPDNFWEGSLVVTAVTTVTFLKELPPQAASSCRLPSGLPDGFVQGLGQRP